MNKLSNENGFSIVQVMIAIGLMGVLSLGLMRMMEGQNRQAKTAKLQMAENNLRNKLSLIVNKKEFCEVNFKGRRKGTEINELLNRKIDINNPDASVYLAVGDEWEHSGLEVVSMKILSQEEEESARYKVIAPSADGSGEVRLRVKVRRKGNIQGKNQTFVGGAEKNIDLNISVKLGYYHEYRIQTSDFAFEEGEKNKLLNACTVDRVDACDLNTCPEPDNLTGNIVGKRIIPCESSCVDSAPEIGKELVGIDSEGSIVHNSYSIKCLIVDDDPNQYIDSCITND